METITQQKLNSLPPEKRMEALRKKIQGKLKIVDSEIEELFSFLK